MGKLKVLFLCTGNSCRSQIAEAIVNARLSNRWEAFSAGSHPAEHIHPLALAVLAEIGIDHQGRPKSIDEFRNMPFEVVVTLYDSANEECPVWLGQGRRIHKAFPDPAKVAGTDSEVIASFRSVREGLAKEITELLTNFKL